jgi:hypothetical protein
MELAIWYLMLAVCIIPVALCAYAYGKATGRSESHETG